ncbi:MAG: DNA alkylation repair protein [Verrucomicrobia bacterium]|nr:DNA alkylation repair protein [Verrucomicrobiota bacterium]
MTFRQFRTSLREQATPKVAAVARSFFKTGPGDYSEGDKFLGLKVPQVRALVKQSDALSEDNMLLLLQSKWHEERLCALLIMVRRFEKAKQNQSVRAHLVKLYLVNTRCINNWDLVDTSAPQLLGVWLLTHDRTILDRLARSKMLWERRIAVIATQTFIRAGQFDDTLRMVRRLLGDQHDLMHKACGWMLREVGKRDKPMLVCFLENHAPQMPRTMLRYAIEHFPKAERLHFMRFRVLNCS